MEKGYYRTNIKKLRNLYAQKLSAVISAMSRYGSQVIRPINSSSGINMLLTVNSSKTPATLSREAAAIGISVLPIATYTEDFPQTSSTMIFYYNQIPLGDIDTAVKSLVNAWKKPMSTIKKTTQNMNGIE
jgi:GntR family transcriptional regulator/MocR family aminotransferase